MLENVLESAEFEALRKHGHITEYKTGDYIVDEGQKGDSIYLLITGSVAVLTEDNEGKELCVNILRVGEFFGELGLCTENWSRSASIRARCTSLVLEVAYREFLRLASGHNELLLRIIHQLSVKLSEMTTRARQFVHMTAPERVLYVLRDLATHGERETRGDGVLVAVTKQEIGNMAGCTRETASRALQELESGGYIRNEGRKVLVTQL